MYQQIFGTTRNQNQQIFGATRNENRQIFGTTKIWKLITDEQPVMEKQVYISMINFTQRCGIM